MTRSDSESYVESTIKKDTWKHRPVSKIDGQGYSDLDTDVIIMNALSRQKNKELGRTKYDTLKSIHGPIYALEASLRQYPQ
ncbi:hypothetical protein BCV72DRAFT_230324 [Rhizopus microsporus var. microsporus]|uniref:Uncharacterized protein n=1 Tax=Rhizopus microsporus var. microsporus TaxID=86635 RepID=A0A1X0QZV7_RHIZD|nr:hypothetical protein BCV72DRAFT_230324 [Rhizopus microsporus var. microsporus]